MPSRSCKGTTQKGKPCKAAPLKDTDYCLAHQDEETRAITGFGGSEAGKLGGRPRRPREIELIQEVAEEQKDRLRAVYADGLTAERALVVGNGPTAHVELVADHPHRHRVAESIIDRLHGRPVQTQNVHGRNESLVVTLDANDPEARDLLGSLLRRRPAITA